MLTAVDLLSESFGESVVAGTKRWRSCALSTLTTKGTALVVE
jgi:hypothetical protein